MSHYPNVRTWRGQSRGPIICIAAVKPHRGAIPGYDHPVAVTLDFVDPVEAGRRF